MKQGVMFGGLAGAVWGLVFLAPLLLGDFPPLLLSCGRFLMYGLVALLATLPIARELLGKLRWSDVPTLLRLALTGNLLYFVLLAEAIQRVGVAPTSLIIGVLPLTVTLLGRHEHDAPPLRQLVGPLLAILAGILCINLETLAGAAARQQSLLDQLLGLGCAALALASWSFFVTDNARCMKRQQRFGSNEWSLLLGLATGLLAALIWLGAWLLGFDSLQPPLSAERWQSFWLINAGLAVVASWLGYALWNACAQRLPLTLSGQMVVFETLFALVYGFIYLQRLPSALELLAIALLLGGVALSVWRHQQLAARSALPAAA
ncbi:multidrug DMT transporter permease [Pseudomonas alcaligenes]|uniref:Multidrug DMT transporter permease n=2 Tax=Aquipseudomonas alcaligenes TaxID=43263 RepID=A0ABR7RVP8_AQUAC|nr:multidrug DMT transporter permease [Pseudomonas alcaligenes]